MRWKTRNPMSSPIPEHENSRFCLFRDKFVIIQAVLNIIVQATASARVFFLHKGLKNERAIGYLKILFFWTTLMSYTTKVVYTYLYAVSMSELAIPSTTYSISRSCTRIVAALLMHAPTSKRAAGSFKPGSIGGRLLRRHFRCVRLASTMQTIPCVFYRVDTVVLGGWLAFLVVVLRKGAVYPLISKHRLSMRDGCGSRFCTCCCFHTMYATIATRGIRNSGCLGFVHVLPLIPHRFSSLALSPLLLLYPTSPKRVPAAAARSEKTRRSKCKRNSKSAVRQRFARGEYTGRILNAGHRADPKENGICAGSGWDPPSWCCSFAVCFPPSLAHTPTNTNTNTNKPPSWQNENSLAFESNVSRFREMRNIWVSR